MELGPRLRVVVLRILGECQTCLGGILKAYHNESLHGIPRGFNAMRLSPPVYHAVLKCNIVPKAAKGGVHAGDGHCGVWKLSGEWRDKRAEGGIR